MYSYDPNNGTITSNYIFSRTGKSYIKPLNSNFYFVGANNGSFTVHITYGNTKNAFRLLFSGMALVTSLIILL